MTDFADSQWAQREAAAEFVENADRYIVERRRMLGVVRSLYRHFVKPRVAGRRPRLLDLGSGDGALTHALLQADATLEATLVDGSEEMLGQARRRLQSYPRVQLVQRSFQELLRGQGALETYDMVVSALAIHHLDLAEKQALFRFVREHLEDGGQFANLDVVVARDAGLEEWYMALWREWIQEAEARDGQAAGQSFTDIPRQYKSNADNVPSPLDDQLAALAAIGYAGVDCYYKYGVFVVYGGRK